MDSKADDRKLASDTNQLVNTFPEEIWLMIVDHVTDNNDLENISNISPYFRNILIPRQTLFLFPKVWQVFEDIFQKECKREYESKYSEIIKAKFPSDHNYGIPCTSCGKNRYPRDYSETLKLCLVCKTWN